MISSFSFSPSFCPSQRPAQSGCSDHPSICVVSVLKLIRWHRKCVEKQHKIKNNQKNNFQTKAERHLYLCMFFYCATKGTCHNAWRMHQKLLKQINSYQTIILKKKIFLPRHWCHHKSSWFPAGYKQKGAIIFWPHPQQLLFVINSYLHGHNHSVVWMMDTYGRGRS